MVDIGKCKTLENAINWYNPIIFALGNCRILSLISAICGNFINLLKFIVEAHRCFVEAFGEVTLSEKTYRGWFHTFSNGEFDRI